MIVIKKTNVCELEFMRADGKVFNVVENSRLVKEHCSEHKDLKVKIKGMLSQKFLLGNGVLYVEDYEVLKTKSDKNEKKTLRITKTLKKLK